MLNDVPYTVAGVFPASFETLPDPSATIWSMLQYDTSLPPQSREWGHHLQTVGRIRDGVSVEQATRDLNVIAASRTPEFARDRGSQLEHGVIVSSLRDDITRDVKPVL